MKRFVMPLIMLLTLGCGASDDLGMLKVHWSVGGSTCAEAQIATVQIHLLDGTTDIIAQPPTANCADGTAGVILPEIPSGTYTVWLEGFDEEGNSWYEGSQKDIKIHGGEQTVVDPPVSLGMKKAALRLKWNFDNGGLCSSNAVASMDITIFDTTSNIIFAEKTACDPPVTKDNPEGGVLATELRGNEELAIAVFGLNAQEERSWIGKTTVTSIPGKTLEVMLSLTPCTESCN